MGGKSLSAREKGRPHSRGEAYEEETRRGDAREGGRLQTGGRAPEASRNTDSNFDYCHLCPAPLGADDPQPPHLILGIDFLPGSLSQRKK